MTSVRVNLRMDEALWARVKVEAYDSNVTQTDVVRLALREYLKVRPPRYAGKPPLPARYTLETVVARRFEMPLALAYRAIEQGRVTVNGEVVREPERETVAVERIAVDS